MAIVGCGTIAPTHAKAVASMPEAGMRVVACCDTVADCAAAFAREFGLRAVAWSDLLTDRSIDAVSICTPSGTHAALGAACLKAGKHVVIEKPLDISLEACDDLIKVHRESGKTLASISQHRYDPASIAVKEAIRQGDLGRLQLVEARVAWFRAQDYYDSASWRGTRALDGGGCVMNQGIHTADLMLWLCGRVVSVFALSRTSGHDRIEVEDNAAAVVTFENGAIGTMTASTAAYPGFPVRLAMYGTLGSAVIEGDALQTLAVAGRTTVADRPADHALAVAGGGTRSASGVATAAPPALSTALASAERRTVSGPGVPPTWGDSHAQQLAEFAHCCRTGESPLGDAVAGRAAVELVLAIYESARTGVAVPLPLAGSA